MPELPEVQTTVMGLRRHIIGLSILDAWSNYNSAYYKGSDTIKDPAYFKRFKKDVLGSKIVSIDRRAKNILIHLSNRKTILIHMKMTGHLLYGKYKLDKRTPKDPWEPIEPESLKDPYNRRVRFLLSLSNGHNVALSDTRRFAKVTLLDTKDITDSLHLNEIGPEPLEESFTFEVFKAQLNKRASGKIKLVLMDQSIIAGIGNIYADESLWRAGIHPAEKVEDIPSPLLKDLYSAIRKTLLRGIDFGGDSMSDYRNVNGEKGKFQEQHYAYRRTGMPCAKKGCKGKIVRIIIGGRSTHFCDHHQKLGK